MKRVALKRGKGLERRVSLRSKKPPNSMSARTKARIPERQRCRPQVWERARGRCEALAVLPHVCSGPMDCHELVSRARGGSIVDPANVVLLCRRIHDFVTTHPAEAHRLGLSLHSWERSA